MSDGRKAPVGRREAPVLLPTVGGFQFARRPNVLLAIGELFVRVGGFPFGLRPNVVLAVGELFVRARSARSQARSA